MAVMIAMKMMTVSTVSIPFVVLYEIFQLWHVSRANVLLANKQDLSVNTYLAARLCVCRTCEYVITSPDLYFNWTGYI